MNFEKSGIDEYYSPYSTFCIDSEGKQLQEEGCLHEMGCLENQGLAFDFDQSMKLGEDFVFQENDSEPHNCVSEIEKVEFKVDLQEEDCAGRWSQQQKQESKEDRQGRQCVLAELDVKTLQAIIQYLVDHSHEPVQDILRFIANQFPSYCDLLLIKILINKFKKLRKTKQELIKYCMRKAFKFIMESHKSDLLKEDLARNNCQKTKMKLLKKIPIEKSMNAAYLRQIFHETGFVADYTRFLKEIKTIIREDNEKKIHYLAQMIVNQSGNFKKIENLRRLPWTGGLLSKANALGKELMKYSEGDS